MKTNYFLTAFWLIGLVEEVPPLIRTLVTLAPALKNVPILGRVIIALSGVKPIDGAKELEELQAAKDKLRKQRKKLADDNNKYVIKVSEAMKCVEKNIDGAMLSKIGRSIIDVLSGNPQDLGTEIIDPINKCMMEERLRQDTPRKGKRDSRIARPAKGHGVGRRKPPQGV
jgi:hypothetical protein